MSACLRCLQGHVCMCWGKYLRTRSRELGHSRQLHAADIQVKVNYEKILFLWVLYHRNWLRSSCEPFDQPPTGGAKEPLPATKPRELFEQYSGVYFLFGFSSPFPLWRFFERFFSWPHTQNKHITRAHPRNYVVHTCSYVALWANLISSHVQILGCTYAISISACGPSQLPHHLNVKYMHHA